MILRPMCIFCGCYKDVEVTEEQADLLLLPRSLRPPVQDILPDHDAGIRELFISQMCPDCWNDTFGDE